MDQWINGSIRAPSALESCPKVVPKRWAGAPEQGTGPPATAGGTSARGIEITGELQLPLTPGQRQCEARN